MSNLKKELTDNAKRKREMPKIYSVRIIRNQNQAIEGEYIKQFWMFCGVYVREFILEYENETSDIQEVDCNIFLAGTDAIGSQRTINKFRAKKDIKVNVRYDDCVGSGMEKRKKFGKQIKQQLLGKFNDMQSDILKVYDVFVNNDMAYINYICHLYLYQFDLDDKRFEKNKKEQIMENYIQCLNDMFKPGEKFEGSVYKKFAYLNCGRKINKICQANRQMLCLNVEAIMREAKLLNKKDAKFSMGNALAGLSGIIDSEQELEAERCLYQAIKHENLQKHSTFLLYKLGRHFEVNNHDWTRGWELYKKIGTISPNDYHYIFKCGVKKFREEKDEESINIFMQIHNEMEKRSKNGWISLLEMEYYYKCTKILNSMKEGLMIYVPIEKTESVLNKLNDNNFLNAFLSNEEREEVKNFFILKMNGVTNKNFKSEKNKHTSGFDEENTESQKTLGKRIPKKII